MRFNNYFLLMLSFALMIVLSGCSGTNNYPENVDHSLTEAGENASELIKVIDHFNQADDSLKLEAAYFLIGNMDEHCYVTYRLFDTTDATVDIDPLAFENYDILTKAVDSIESDRGELDYESQDKIYDVKTINADFLINQINLAFEVWLEKPWAKLSRIPTRRWHMVSTIFCRPAGPTKKRSDGACMIRVLIPRLDRSRVTTAIPTINRRQSLSRFRFMATRVVRFS